MPVEMGMWRIDQGTPKKLEPTKMPTEAELEHPDGTLLLNFAGGASVAVPPDVNYEAWSVIGPGNALVVCMPGTAGELAIWGRTLPPGG